MSVSVGWTKTKGSWEGIVKVAPKTFECLWTHKHWGNLTWQGRGKCVSVPSPGFSHTTVFYVYVYVHILNYVFVILIDIRWD